MSESDVERAQTEAENLPPCTCHDVMGGQVHEEGCIRGQAIRSRREISRREITSIPEEAWQGTEPAEGTRRALIRDSLVEPFAGLTDELRLEIADVVESALLKATIDDEAEKPYEINGLLGSLASLAEKQTESHRNLRRTDPHFAEYHRGAEGAYRILREKIEAAEIGSDPDRPSIPASEAMDELDRVGIPRTRDGESRCAEERDCAFALLRWLLPVTVAKRLDD